MSTSNPTLAREKLPGQFSQRLQQSSALRSTQTILLIGISLLYSGGVQIVNYLSPFLYYGFFLLLIGCAVVRIGRFTRKRIRYHFRPVHIYALWLTFYFLWGAVFSTHLGEVMPDLVRAVMRNLVILCLVAIALDDRDSLSRLSIMIQIAVLVNCAISIYEYFNPSFVTYLAYTFYESAQGKELFLDELRPAGLWINPNDAAFSFLFGLLVSYWSKGSIAWAGRIAAIVGIYLTASRGGSYSLIICAVLFISLRLFSQRLSTARLSTMAFGLAMMVAAAWVLSYQSGTWLNIAPGEGGPLSRILDIQESTSSVSRSAIKAAAIESARNGPLQGHGIFSFQTGELAPYRTSASTGAHDIYLVAWGETGMLGLLLYILVLGIYVVSLVKEKIVRMEKSAATILWLAYLVAGTVAHTQFNSLVFIIPIALLCQMARLLRAEIEGRIYGHPLNGGNSAVERRQYSGGLQQRWCGR